MNILALPSPTLNLTCMLVFIFAKMPTHCVPGSQKSAKLKIKQNRVTTAVGYNLKARTIYGLSLLFVNIVVFHPTPLKLLKHDGSFPF